LGKLTLFELFKV